MIKIENIENLKSFILKNFNSLPNEVYYSICFNSLGLITNKPETVTEAIEEITKYYELIKDLPEGWERPLWVMNENDFDE